MRFWLRFLGPGIELAARGRGSIVVDRIRESWTSYRGAAIEPIVRASLERILPDPRLGAARFVGSIKWREAASFDRADVARLIGHRDRVPGGTERSILVGVSRSGFETGDLDVALKPSDILDAWR